jgi:hypothetical protein
MRLLRLSLSNYELSLRPFRCYSLSISCLCPEIMTATSRTNLILGNFFFRTYRPSTPQASRQIVTKHGFCWAFRIISFSLRRN